MARNPPLRQVVTPQIEHSHTPDDIARRLARGPQASYLRDWVDGAVTTFAIVAGATGGSFGAGGHHPGRANLLADGFSMAAGNYCGTRAEQESYARLLEMERRHVALEPEGEREEIRQIFARKGFRGASLADILRLVTAREETWIDTMMGEEHGLAPVRRSPWRAAGVTFLGFLVAGSLPLVPFALSLPRAGEMAAVATGLTFFLIGSVRSRWSPRSWWSSGLETFFIGMLAASVAYLVGYLLNGLA